MVCVKSSDKTGHEGKPLGKGLFAGEKIMEGQIICHLWGNFYSLPVPSNINNHVLVSLRGKEWKNIALAVSEVCPGKFINAFDGTGSSANAKFIQQELKYKVSLESERVRLQNGYLPHELIQVVALVDIEAETEILADYGTLFFSAEAPVPTEVILPNVVKEFIYIILRFFKLRYNNNEIMIIIIIHFLFQDEGSYRQGSQSQAEFFERYLYKYSY